MPWRHSRSRTPICGVSARAQTLGPPDQGGPGGSGGSGGSLGGSAGGGVGEEDYRPYSQSASDTSKTSDLYESIGGKHWYYGFLKRHPELSTRKPSPLAHQRAGVTQEEIRKWYETFREHLTDTDCLDALEPQRIFNCDESGFPLCVATGKVLALKGSKNVYQRVSNTKQQITVLACMSGSGMYMPPYIIYPGKRIRNIDVEGFEEAIFGTSDSGWMTGEVFYDFLSLFDKKLEEEAIQRPVILLVDGHVSHVTLQAAQFCSEKKIVLYSLHPHASHIHQPCDLTLFGPMKQVWKDEVRMWHMKNLGVCFTKKDFPAVFKATWEKTATPENAVKGFQKAGFCPFNPSAVDTSRFLATNKQMDPNITTTTHNPPQVATTGSPTPRSVPQLLPIGTAAVATSTLPSTLQNATAAVTTSTLPSALQNATAAVKMSTPPSTFQSPMKANAAVATSTLPSTFQNATAAVTMSTPPSTLQCPMKATAAVATSTLRSTFQPPKHAAAAVATSTPRSTFQPQKNATAAVATSTSKSTFQPPKIATAAGAMSKPRSTPLPVKIPSAAEATSTLRSAAQSPECDCAALPITSSTMPKHFEIRPQESQCVVQPTALNKSGNISAFMRLDLPTAQPKPKRQCLSAVLPNAISGYEAITIMQKREEAKKVAEKDKEERKRDRLKRKQEKEEAARLRKDQIAKKKKEAARKKEEKKKLTEERKKMRKRHKIPAISSESENDEIPEYMESDEEDDAENDICSACNGRDGSENEWIGCDECPRWYHLQCCEDENAITLAMKDLEKYVFICASCKK